MKTMSTVDKVERTESGAYKITFLGDQIAGTRDEEIGKLAERLAGDDTANPVALIISVRNGRAYVDSMEEILPPADDEPDTTVAEVHAKVTGHAPADEPYAAAAAEVTAEEKAEAVLDALKQATDGELLDELGSRLEGRIPMEQC